MYRIPTAILIRRLALLLHFLFFYFFLWLLVSEAQHYVHDIMVAFSGSKAKNVKESSSCAKLLSVKNKK